MPDHRPTLCIELTWHGGIVEESRRFEPTPEPQYDLLDDKTGKPLAAGSFTSCQELEAYIAKHFPDCRRAALPPPPPEEQAMVEKALELAENPPEGLLVASLRAALTGQYYQWTHSGPIRKRLRHALGLAPLEE